MQIHGKISLGEKLLGSNKISTNLDELIGGVQVQSSKFKVFSSGSQRCVLSGFNQP
jgi:hypothetical protein